MTTVVKPSEHGSVLIKKKKKSPTYLPNIYPTRSDLLLEKVQRKNYHPLPNQKIQKTNGIFYTPHTSLRERFQILYGLL